MDDRNHRRDARRPALFGGLAALLLTLAACGPPTTAAEPQMDWQPPGFQLTGADGKPFRYPEDLKGPTIVLFWATWCPYCKALMPHLQSIAYEYAGHIEVLALDINDDGDPVKFLEENGYTFHLLPAADPVAESWGVPGTPGLFLVDATGRVVFSNFAIPKEAYPEKPERPGPNTNHARRAARVAPFWAAELRRAIDGLPL